MAFNDKVEVTPAPFVTGQMHTDSALAASALQKRKWRVLGTVFTLCFGIFMLWVWLRPPVYQSQAILYFDYAKQLNQAETALPEEQITLNSQRLISHRIVSELSQRLAEAESMSMDTADLAAMMSSQYNLNSRTITLSTRGENKEVLRPILQHWLALFVEQLAQETATNTSDSLSEGQQKLAALELKIAEQRSVVEQFSEAHNIVSVERDENRALSKMKHVSTALDEAQNAKAQAEAELHSVQQSLARGEVVSHPEDRTRLDQLYTQITDIESELARLGQNFTQRYMEMDPDIVGQKRKLEELQSRYKTTLAQSQERYLEALQRSVDTAQQKQSQLEKDLQLLSQEALVFNQNLQEYSRLLDSLEQLQGQAQQLKDQLVQSEVQKPYEAKVTVLEAPFSPQYPIAPDYWRDSLIAIAASVLLSFCAFWLYSTIHRPEQAGPSITSYNIVPPANGLTFEQQRAAQSALAQQGSQQQLGHSQQAAALAVDVVPHALSSEECQRLYAAGNRDGKLIISLLFCGVAPEELLTLSHQQIDSQNGIIELKGDYPRRLVLHREVLAVLAQSPAIASPQTPLFFSRLANSDLDLMVVNMAHDAGLQYPDHFTIAALRHSYLVFLVSQGLRLNDIEQIAGFVSPTELTRYRGVKRSAENLAVDQVNTCLALS